MTDSRGFTLTETLIALIVGVIVMGAIYLAVNMGQRTSSILERKVTAHQDAKYALDLMAMEVGMASYYDSSQYPSGITWRNPSVCANASATNAYHGVQVATSTALSIEMDLDDSGGIGGTNEIITYQYLPNDLCLTREVNCGGGQPFLGNTATSVAAGNPRTVRVINNDLNIPMFRYYDGSGTVLNLNADQTLIPNIRRIEITLAVETEAIDPDLGQRRRMIYSTAVIPRNHAITANMP